MSERSERIIDTVRSGQWCTSPELNAARSVRLHQ